MSGGGDASSGEDHDGGTAFSAAQERGFDGTAAIIAHFALARGLHQQRERGEGWRAASWLTG